MRAESKTLSKGISELKPLGFWEKLLQEEDNGTLTVDLASQYYQVIYSFERPTSKICARIERNTLSDAFLWGLVVTGSGQALLLRLLKKDFKRLFALLETANLDAAPLSRESLFQGKTVLWLLVSTRSGRALLLGLSKIDSHRLLALLETANLDAGPLSQESKHRGETVLWRLVSTQSLLWSLLKAYPDRFLTLLEKANLDAAPLSRESLFEGKTVLWWLVSSKSALLWSLSKTVPDHLSAFLLQRPSLLLRVSINTQFQFSAESINKGYLIESLAESTTPEARTLLSYCLLAGFPLALLSRNALCTHLMEKRTMLVAMAERAALIMNATGWEEATVTEQNNELNLLDLPVEVRFTFCLQLFSEHLKLSRISSSFLNEIFRREGKNQYHKNAIIVVCKGIGNKLRECVMGDANGFRLYRLWKEFRAPREKGLAKRVTQIVHDYLHKYCQKQGSEFRLSHSLRNDIITAAYEAVAPCFKKEEPQALKASVIENAIQSALTETAPTFQ